MCEAFWQVMAFYALLSCVIAPLIGYKMKGLHGLGDGYVAGTIISIGLWFTVGKKYAGM